MAGTHFSNLNVRLAFAVGGSAGDLTLTGITTSDKLLSVWVAAHDGDGDIVSVSNLTSEFSITAANTINNTGGTATTDKLVGILYLDADA